MEFVFAIRPIPKLFTTKAVALALERIDLPFVYHVEAHAVCLIVDVIAGTPACRLFAPL